MQQTGTHRSVESEVPSPTLEERLLKSGIITDLERMPSCNIYMVS
jgi:hypothetical protein